MQSKNTFVERLLKDMMKTFSTVTKTMSRLSSMDEINLILGGEAAFYFAQKTYAPEVKETTDLSNQPIQFITQKSYDTFLLKVIQTYGSLVSFKTNVSANKEINKIISVTLDVNNQDCNSGFCALVSTLIAEMFGDLKLNFDIYVTEGIDYDMSERVFVKDCLTAEYVSELDMFMYTSHANRQYKSESLLLKNIAAQTLIKDNKYEIIDYDHKIALDPEEVVKIVLSGKDMRTYELLPYNEETFDKDGTCSICQEDIKTGFKTSCGHLFHCECLEQFLKIYYTELSDSVNRNENHNLVHDRYGNIIKGASYTWCCPNCKSPCFKLNVKNGIVTNPQNCIYRLTNDKNKKIVYQYEELD